MNDYDRLVQERLDQHATADEAGKLAARAPLPGPLRDAFAPVPDIEVGNLKVRPFYDADFYFLSFLGHPVAGIGPEFMATHNDDEVRHKYELVLNGILPTGPSFWQIAWLLTRSIEECEDAFAQKKDVKRAALLQFGKLQTVALQQLHLAVFKQFNIYWSTVLDYGGATVGEDGEAAKASVPPSGAQPMGSAGFLTSNAA